jgi:PAS domain S-box-containing protein
MELAELKKALDQSAIVALTDNKGVIIDVNEKFCEISGYSKDELIGQTHKIVNSGFHSEKYFKDMWSEIKLGRRWEGEIRNKKKDGSYYWVHTTITPLFSEKENLGERGTIKNTQFKDVQPPTQFLSIRFDITERKNAEMRLQEFSKLAALDLTDPVRKIRDYFGILKDELLKAAQGNLDQLIQFENSNLNAQLLFQRIDLQIQQMMALAKGLGHLAHMHVEKEGFQWIDLKEIWSEVLKLFEEVFSREKVELKFNDFPKVFGQSEQLKLLLTNLMSNALKFRDKQRPIVIDVQCKDSGDGWCEIFVSDNGLGFDPARSNDIFKGFTRLHLHLNLEGIGLGLALCRRIVEDHGGTITATSVPGRGSVFCIRLPGLQKTGMNPI